MKTLIRISTAFAAAALLLVPVTTINANPTDDPIAQAHIVKGDELAAEGRYGSARGEYRKAVELQREQGVLPETALRRIAYTFYYEDRFQSAGGTMVDLAEEAATYGDIVAEVWALADAAWIAGVEGNKQVVDRHLAKVDKLLTSPYLPEDVKNQIRTTRLASIESFETLTLTP